MDGLLQLNNKDLVNKGVDVIQTELQDLVISEMKYRYGLDWWYEGIVSKGIKLPLEAPRGHDVPDDATREFLDVPRLCSLLTDRDLNLLSDGYLNDSKSLLYNLKSVRNKKSHFGKPNYTAEQARDALEILKKLNDALDLDVGEDIDRIIQAVVEDHPKNDSASAPAPEEPKQPIVLAPVPPNPMHNIGDICEKACEGMYRQMEEIQKDHRTRARFTSDAKYTEKDGCYLLTLSIKMKIDDTTGIIIDGVEFGSNAVSFEGYDKDGRTVTMYPGPEAKKVLDEGEGECKLTLFSDMKWITSRTIGFFKEYGNDIAYPPTPSGIFSKDTFLSGKLEGMTKEQADAVMMSLCAPLSYVWGVPGSGKTQYVLATAINECIARGERVAVIAPTNMALEQVLSGLMAAFEKNKHFKVDPKTDVIRIGNPTADFVKNYPFACENRKVRSEVNDREATRDRCRIILSERRYESLKDDVDRAVKFAKENPETEKTAAKLYDLMKPLIDAMAGDQRFRLNAERINVRNVYSVAVQVRNMIYNRDRSAYLEGSAAGLSDTKLKSEISSANADIKRLMKSNPKADINTCKVVAMTLSKFIVTYGPRATGNRIPLKVDHVFVDEAGYCNLAQIMTLFSMKAPVTMLGDHMQLPPVCEVDRDKLVDDFNTEDYRYNCLWGMSALYADELFKESAEAVLDSYKERREPEFGFTTIAKLPMTHRFGQNLADILGDEIYDMDMVSGAGGNIELEVIDAAISEFPIEHGKCKRKNIKEAKAIAKYIRSGNPSDYIVLTPYRDQVGCLKDMGIDENRISTIHSAQGREWDTVIISVCDGSACNREKPPRFTSTVSENGAEAKKILNTAISRAKRKLVIVCDKSYWTSKDGELIGRIVRDS